MQGPDTQHLIERRGDFLAYLERRLGDGELARDILQDSFVKALTVEKEIGSDDSVVRWFYGVLRNAVIDHFRRSGTRSAALAKLAREMSEQVVPPEEIEQIVCSCVDGLARALKPSYAEVIRKVDIEGLSVQKFAREAGISDSNASVRLHRARAALRKSVAGSCGKCAARGCLDCSCRRA